MKKHTQTSIFPLFRRVLIIALIFLEFLLITGGYSKTGRTWLWISQYMVNFMSWMAKDVFNSTNGIGFAIIVMTAVIRLILFPIMYKQQRDSTIQAEKMAMLQPQLSKIQDALKKSSSQEEKITINTAMMSVYRENGVSLTGGINFLSMLIQLPVISALYTAIRLSTSTMATDHIDPSTFNSNFLLNGSHFFGIPLYRPSIIIALIAAVFYIGQSWLSLKAAPEAQRKQMSTMIWFSPIMIFFFSIFQSAALGLYFMVGGIFVLVQTAFILKNRPALQKQVRSEFKVKNVVDDLLKDAKKSNDPGSIRKDIKSETGSKTLSDRSSKNDRNRNKGKQKRKPKI